MSDYDDARDDLRWIVSRNSGFSIREGRPIGQRQTCKYICACVHEQWLPVALILDPSENSKHARVKLVD